MSEIETWVENEGLNPRSDNEWKPDVESGDPVPVRLYPYDVPAVHCDCYEIHGEYALIKVPPEDESGPSSITNWYPYDGWHWAVVPEIFIRGQ